MTAKEKREMQRLRNRIEELEKERERYFAVYREHSCEIVELRTALKNIHDALVDAVGEANRVLRGTE